ncbi:MAG: helix-turn-helix transcriptional regulator [Spirochaetaceae bacterium]|nr:helix-turn-helix transcriptional regulator [Spirochaetaceae bacterium]
MLKDCILVIAGIVVFMIPAILQKERRSQLKIDFSGHLSKLAVLSGMFVSIVKLLILISDLEILQKTDGKEIASISSSAFFIMIFVKFRPAMLGVLIKLILQPFSKKKKIASNTQSGIEISSEKPEDSFALLSPREKEVARLAARGYSNAQIAEELYISVETVKRHMATIFEKLKIKSRKDLGRLSGHAR